MTSAANTQLALRDLRRAMLRFARLWRRSLRFRTTLITVVLTALSVAVAFMLMALAIRTDLFETRRDGALDDARRAVAVAQEDLASAEVAGDRAAVQQLMNQVMNRMGEYASTELIAAFRIDEGASQLAPPSLGSPGLTVDLLSEGLRERVRSTTDSQWWQSVALQSADGSEVAGIVVGQQLTLQNVASYEIYMAYDLADASETLLFVERTLWIAGVALLVIIAAISWIVLRSVAKPIIETAGTSARFASGDLEVRLPARGHDELALLARSFNAMADSIESQITELSELSRMQQRFVSDVSHELRTPLTTIRLAADMLYDHRADLDPAATRAAELLHDQVDRFQTLLNDLLEISRYDAGSVQLELEPMSLSRLAEDVVESMRQLAEERGSELRLVEPGGHSPVDLDPRRGRRVLRNLVGNAIEHGEGRPIVVTVDSDQRSAAIGVRDFGLGMTEHEVERVFDRFWRADPSRRRTIGGSGLGLSIALGDARLHGGRIEVWSQPGRGSHFVLTVPRVPGEQVTTSPISVEPSEDPDDEHTQPIVTVAPREGAGHGESDEQRGQG